MIVSLDEYQQIIARFNEQEKKIKELEQKIIGVQTDLGRDIRLLEDKIESLEGDYA